ncbi:MAG TPA: hypothetical protein PK765_04820 [bacterium]|nr:hypothetical protein [bacterium]
MPLKDSDIRAKIVALVTRSECLAPSVASYADTLSGKPLENLLITIHDIVHRESRLDPSERERFRRIASGLNQELARKIREAAQSRIRTNESSDRTIDSAGANELLRNC